MDSRHSRHSKREGISALTLHGLSGRSALLGAIFIAALFAAFFVAR